MGGVLMAKCEFKKDSESKKLFCKTHDQFILYIYHIDGIIFARCQVGEDLHEPIQRLIVIQK